MSLYAAIDLHSTNSVLAVIDETDRPLRQRRLPNELPAILKELEPFRDEIEGIVRMVTGAGSSCHPPLTLGVGDIEQGYSLLRRRAAERAPIAY